MLRLPRLVLAASILLARGATPALTFEPQSTPKGAPSAPASVLQRETLEDLPLRGTITAAVDTIPGARPIGTWTLDGLVLPPDGEADWLGSSSWRHASGIEVRRDSPPAAVHGAPQTVTILTRGSAEKLAGSANIDYTDHHLQSSNVTPALRIQGAGFGNPIRQEAAVDVEAGLPVVRGRAWLWGAAGRSYREAGIIGFYEAECNGPDGTPEPGARYRPDCMHPDVTTVTTTSARLQLAWNPGSRTTATWTRTRKRKPNRGASAHVQPESTTRQSTLGGAHPLRVQHAWAASGAWQIDAAATVTDAGVVFDFQSPSLAAVQAAYDRYNLANWRSARQSRETRRAVHTAVSATALARDLPRGTLSIRFGGEWDARSERAAERAGGGATAVFDSRSGESLAWQARIYRDGATSHDERRWAAFTDATWRVHRLTVNAGLRIDRQDDWAGTADSPASALLPDLLPALHFAGADSQVIFGDVSPRVALAWSLDAAAGTLVRAGAARYRAAGNDSSALLQPTRLTRLTYWWTDANRDRFIQANEIDLARGLASRPSSNYDPANPSSPLTPTSIDPRLRNVVTDEFSFALERQLGARVTVRAGYVGRKLHDMGAAYPVNEDGSAVRSDSYYPLRWAPASCPPGAACPPVTYWQRDAQLPATTSLRNDGRFAWRHGADLTVRRRPSGGWMLEAAIAWNRSALHYPRATRDYTDPTNIAQRDGTEYSMPAPRWEARLSGTARLPWRLRAAAIVAARGGLPFDRAVSSPNRGALGSTNVSIARYGSARYPQSHSLDCRVSWHLAAGRVRLVPAIDVFNSLNSNAVLTRNRVQNSASANRVTGITAPRLLRAHVRVQW